MATTSADIAAKPFHDLAAVLRGELIQPGGPGYDEGSWPPPAWRA